jgi:hypothetical protein
MGLGAAQGSWRAIYKVSAVMQVTSQHCNAMHCTAIITLFCSLSPATALPSSPSPSFTSSLHPPASFLRIFIHPLPLLPHFPLLPLLLLIHLYRLFLVLSPIISFIIMFITVQGGALLAYVLCDKLLLSDSPSFVQRQSLRLKQQQQLNSKGQAQGRGQGQSIGGANQVTVDSAAAAAAAAVGVSVGVPESLSQVLRRISTDRRFWLMLAGKVALMTVGQFISFIPLYLRTGTVGATFHHNARLSNRRQSCPYSYALCVEDKDRISPIYLTSPLVISLTLTLILSPPILCSYP